MFLTSKSNVCELKFHVCKDFTVCNLKSMLFDLFFLNGGQKTGQYLV